MKLFVFPNHYQKPPDLSWDKATILVGKVDRLDVAVAIVLSVYDNEIVYAVKQDDSLTIDTVVAHIKQDIVLVDDDDNLDVMQVISEVLAANGLEISADPEAIINFCDNFTLNEAIGFM